MSEEPFEVVETVVIVHKQTLVGKKVEVKNGVPAYPDPSNASDWLVGPDMSAVLDVPRKYWKIEGAAVVEMTAEEKQAVDAAALEVIKTKRMGEVDEETSTFIAAGFEWPIDSGNIFSLSLPA